MKFPYVEQTSRHPHTDEHGSLVSKGYQDFRLQTESAAYVGVIQHGNMERYSVSFPLADVSQDLAETIPVRMARFQKDKDGLMHLRSRNAPMIFGKKPDSMDAFDFIRSCRARQINPNKLLKGQALQMHLRVHWFDPKDFYRIRNMPSDIGEPVLTQLIAVRAAFEVVGLPSWNSDSWEGLL